MNFEGDAFISYAHLDNVELIEGRKGWVANLHRALEVRVGQLLGKPLQVWRDPKLSGNDFFADALVDRLKRVATLISVVSPRYVKSEWTRRELSEFWKAAEEQGGVSYRNKARIFKILKTPVPLELHPPELRSLLGYEFFKIDPETGRVRELDEVFGPEAQRDFWLKLDDLAHDICCLLEMLEVPEAAPSSAVESGMRAVYLAETASDLREQREVVRRDLQQHGYTVLPALALPPVASELQAAVRADLAQCAMSIHLVGKSYSLVPEGGEASLVEMQNELAIERGEKGDFSRFVWIPPGLEVTDARQRKVIENLRMDPRVQKGADLLETSLEDLRTVYQERLKKPEEPVPAAPAPVPDEPAAVAPPTRDVHPLLYLMYDQLDSAVAPACVDYLYQQGFEVIRPVFEGDEADIREEHEENLRSCDGALILYGAACECWLRRKLRELQKSPGYGRTKPKPVVAISLLPPRSAEKESFRTHEAIMIPQMDGFSPDPLGPFVSRLKG
jgi:TIR domain